MTAPSNPAEVGGYVLVPREPTGDMLKAGMDDLGWWCEPYEAPRESGVPVDTDMSAEEATRINSMQIEVVASAFRAMLSAAPSPPIGEPVAWVTADILAALKRGESAVPGWKRSADFCIPLYAALVPARVEAVDHIAGKMVPEIIDALIEASNQIEYLHGKFQETGSGNAVITKLAEVRRALQGNPS